MGLIVNDDRNPPATWLDDEAKAAALDAHLDGIAPRYAEVQATPHAAPATPCPDPLDAKPAAAGTLSDEAVGVARAGLIGVSILIAGQLWPRLFRLAHDLLQAAA